MTKVKPTFEHPTDATTEHLEQKKWRLRPNWRNNSHFDRLVDREFRSLDEHNAWECSSVAQIVRFAATQVPYYEALFRRHGLDSRDITEPARLAALPMLHKQAILDQFDTFRPRVFPEGHEVTSYAKSSGTTGPPVTIMQNQQTANLFAMLKQRELRWFRFNPERQYAAIRWPTDLPAKSTEEASEEDITHQLPSWPYLGRYFETGPYIAYSLANSIDKQKQWLDTHRPEYLVSYAPALEHLAFVFEDTDPPDYLRGVESISMQLTPDMERRITRTMGVPVHQNYGLNEIGMVASMCPVGKRFHVHTEHCLVEIVDKDGKPCAPGQLGRILVTTMNNTAMPLIRYDTDDLAVPLDGPCPCGRTLPSFGEIRGRYRHYVSLPEGLLEYAQFIRQVLERTPHELMCGLRQFQIHLSRENIFELRLVTVEPLTEILTSHIGDAFSAHARNEKVSLRIIRVAEIPLPPSGKFQDFVSDYFPAW
jgi:phenylacetate-CoA ligase